MKKGASTLKNFTGVLSRLPDRVYQTGVGVPDLVGRVDSGEVDLDVLLGIFGGFRTG